MKFFRDFGAALLVALLALGACEGFMRLTGLKHEASFYEPDPVRGYHLRPHAKGWQTTEGESWVEINSAGFHDREHAVARPADTIRIAVLGSSEGSALQVPADKTFSSLLEPKLNDRLKSAGKRVEVINFSTDGYNLPQIALTLQQQVWAYDPQIVVLTYVNYLVLKNSRELSDDPKARYYQINGGGIELDQTSKEAASQPRNEQRLRLRNLASTVMNHSRFLSAANMAFVNFSREIEAWRAEIRSSQVAAGQAPLPPDMNQLWPYLSPDDTEPAPDPRLVRASS